MAARRGGILALITTLFVASCASPPPPAPTYVRKEISGWQRADGAPTNPRLAEQAKLICDGETSVAISQAMTLMDKAVAQQSIPKACMARNGYLPVYDN